jgi:hypothetical protein
MKDKFTPILMLLLALLIAGLNQAEAQTSPDSCYATYVVSFNPGTKKNGTPIDLPDNFDAIIGKGVGDEDAISLGMEGEIILGFTNPVPVAAGDDLWVQERDGQDNRWRERVKVEVSANGTDYVTVTENLLQSGALDVPEGVGSIKYVKLTDVSDPDELGNTADGYDLDGIAALHTCPDPGVAEAPTVAFNNPEEKECSGADVEIVLTGEGPWKVGYTNGPDIKSMDIATSPATIPLDLTDEVWLAWVTDKNEYTTVVDNSDTIKIAQGAEAYFRESYVEKDLVDYEICSGGGGIQVPLILKGKSPWNITYAFTQGETTETLNLEVKKTKVNDTYWWELFESGSYQLLSVEDDCGAGTVRTMGDSVKIDSVVLVDLPSAKFLDLDTVCVESEDASLKVELTGKAPWKLSWEVEGVEYTQTDIDSALFTIPLNLIGKYTLKSVEGSANCLGIIEEDSIVRVLSPPVAQLTQKETVICDTSDESVLIVNLSGSAPFTFAYTLDGNPVDTVETSFETYEIPVSAAGTYQLAWVRNACGNGTAEGTAERLPLEQVFSSFSYQTLSQSCNQATLLLQADSISNDFQYQWYVGGQLTGEESSLEVSSTIGSNLAVSLVTKQGLCSDSTSQTVAVESAGASSLGRFQWSKDGGVTCEGQSLIFTSDSTNASFTYQWKVDGVLQSEEAIFTPQLESGKYSIQLTVDDGGCLYISNQTIEIPEYVPEELASFSYQLDEDAQCEGQVVRFQADSVNSEFSYRWTVNGTEVNRATSFAYKLAVGESEVVLEVMNGNCSYTISENFTVENLSLSNAGEFDFSTEVLSCGVWQLSATALDLGEGLQYQWWLNDELIGEQEQVSRGLPPGDHVLRLLVGLGDCRYETQEVISVSETESLVNVPNVLSPQAAHPDDRVVKVYGTCVAAEGFHFQIIDRWGGLAYETKSADEAMTQGWDGSDQSSGIYTYVLRGQFDSGIAFQQQGTITLLK